MAIILDTISCLCFFLSQPISTTCSSCFSINLTEYAGSAFISALCIVFLWTQLAFILLLFGAAFYKDCAAFSEKEKDEPLSALYQIPNESLQAFLYLKCSQMPTQKISIRLKVQLMTRKYQVGMDVINMTRVLGILLDNAMEKAHQGYNINHAQNPVIPGSTLEIYSSIYSRKNTNTFYRLHKLAISFLQYLNPMVYYSYTKCEIIGGTL